jgi:hypothetical protein
MSNDWKERVQISKCENEFEKNRRDISRGRYEFTKF